MGVLTRIKDYIEKHRPMAQSSEEVHGNVRLKNEENLPEFIDETLSKQEKRDIQKVEEDEEVSDSVLQWRPGPWRDSIPCE